MRGKFKSISFLFSPMLKPMTYAHFNQNFWHNFPERAIEAMNPPSYHFSSKLIWPSHHHIRLLYWTKPNLKYSPKYVFFPRKFNFNELLHTHFIWVCVIIAIILLDAISEFFMCNILSKNNLSFYMYSKIT